jgi:uncharacterized membrane protein
MNKRWLIGLILLLTVGLVACPGTPPPNDNAGVWDTSTWDSGAVWK